MVDSVCATYTHTYCTCIRYTVHNTEMCSNCGSTVLQRLNKSCFQFNSYCFWAQVGDTFLAIEDTKPAAGLEKELCNNTLNCITYTLQQVNN